MSKTFLIYGASQGLGKAIVQSIPDANDTVFAVSRSNPQHDLHWIGADLSDPKMAVSIVKEAIASTPLDCVIYNVGIWEHDAFTDAYDFSKCSDDEILTLVQTNISSCLLNLKAVLPNLQKSDNAKIILIGSTWGLDNHNGKEVAFSASKYAVRGIAHALRETLREFQIGISVLNLGYLATEFTIDVPTANVLQATQDSLIPLSDVIAAIRFILSTSKASCVKEINMPAMADTNM